MVARRILVPPVRVRIFPRQQKSRIFDATFFVICPPRRMPMGTHIARLAVYILQRCLVGKEEAAAATRNIRVLFIQEGIQGGGEVFADLIAESDGAVAVEDNNAGNAADTVGISGSGLAVYPYFPG